MTIVSTPAPPTHPGMFVEFPFQEFSRAYLTFSGRFRAYPAFSEMKSRKRRIPRAAVIALAEDNGNPGQRATPPARI
jgi:hypothetical protein